MLDNVIGALEKTHILLAGSQKERYDTGWVYSIDGDVIRLSLTAGKTKSSLDLMAQLDSLV